MEQNELEDVEDNSEPIVVAEELPVEELPNPIEEKYKLICDDLNKEFAVFEKLEQNEENENKQKEILAQIIQTHLGISVDEMKTAISEYIMKYAEELSMQFVNITPFNNYDNLLEDNDDIAAFLRKDGSKIEHWKLFGLAPSDVSTDLMKCSFCCTATDENDEFVGFVFVNSLGKIKHCFAQGGEG